MPTYQDYEEYDDFHVRVRGGGVTAPKQKHQHNVKVMCTTIPPQGLQSIHLSCVEKLERALTEARNIVEGPCASQIGNNQHFFINKPFPLVHHREANTPVFPFKHPEVENLSHLVTTAMEQLGCPKECIAEMIPRANIIVRQYNPGQHISFHIDEHECDSQVFGYILENEDSTHKGLVFKRSGEGSQEEIEYVLPEYMGTAFVMADQARYKWKHGVPTVTARRVSVTVRFFKKCVLQQHSTCAPELPTTTTTAPTSTTAVTDTNEEECSCAPVRVWLVDNGNHTNSRLVLVDDGTVCIKDLKIMAKNKLRMKPKQVNVFCLEDGTPLVDGNKLDEDVRILVCCNIPTVSSLVQPKKNKEEGKVDSELRSIEIPSSFGFDEHLDLLTREIMQWKSWKYPKLRFYVLVDATHQQRPNNEEYEVVETVQQLGQLVETSFLSVPEIRELLQHLQKLVTSTGGVVWGFRTKLWELGDDHCTAGSGWDTGRMTCIYIINTKTNVSIQFRVEGQRALKGVNKRDGPLWCLEGGLNNENKKISEDTIVIQTEDFSDEENEEGSEAASIAIRAQPTQGKSKRGNLYQQKRGVIHTTDLVLFAGTVWPSSYYRCSILIDSVHYTTVAQFVLAEQARLFKDDNRLNEILSSSDHPNPHKAYDHKAPKTGKRRVANFDAQVWEDNRGSIMFRGTVEKFLQNSELGQKLLETGNKTIVEATDDTVWGIGITLNNLQEATNMRKWRGTNDMGKLLERVRVVVRSKGIH